MPSRVRVVVAAIACALATAGCAADGPSLAAAPAPTPSTAPSSTPSGAPATTASGPLLENDRNLSDCLSSLPPPDCRSAGTDTRAQLITFGVLMAGMSFIGWRIWSGVRRRDRLADPPPRD